MNVQPRCWERRSHNLDVTSNFKFLWGLGHQQPDTLLVACRSPSAGCGRSVARPACPLPCTCSLDRVASAMSLSIRVGDPHAGRVSSAAFTITIARYSRPREEGLF